MLEGEDEPGETEGQTLQETGVVTETEEQPEEDQSEPVPQEGGEEAEGLDSEPIERDQEEEQVLEEAEGEADASAYSVEEEPQQDGDLVEQAVEEEEAAVESEAVPEELTEELAEELTEELTEELAEEKGDEEGERQEEPSKEEEEEVEEEDSEGDEIDVGTEEVPTETFDLVQENAEEDAPAEEQNELAYEEDEKAEVQDETRTDDHLEEEVADVAQEVGEEEDVKELDEENAVEPAEIEQEVESNHLEVAEGEDECIGEDDVVESEFHNPEGHPIEEGMELGEDEEHSKNLDIEDGMEIDETPEPSEAADLALEEGKDLDPEDGVNGIAGIEAEDEEDVNDDVDELSPEDLFNIAPSDGKALPQCRLKRNYTCVHCGFNTQNPREHLYHLRDEHGERMKVFECPRCIYASKNQQKLIRHARMVHKLKIKRQESGNSPYKSHKSSRVKLSPSKSARESVSPGKSSRSSPGKSPRSSESTHDMWEGMDEYEDEDLEMDDSPVKGDERKMYFCEQCDYSCRSRKILNRHETSFHLKRRFFRCVKCNYVTHLKGRYTKHMKYHQLPILKCEYCDFRTPYRWNLDRHMKNHVEDCGEYKCHLCNFTAQIKQSLTVHISNHHLTAEQIREREMRRTIGISDPADCTSDDQELELLRMERDEHPDALILPGFGSPTSPGNGDSSQGHHNGNSFRVSNIDMGNHDDSHLAADDSKDEDGEPRKKKPKIKITLKKMKLPKSKDTFFQELNERHNFEEDFIHPDDVVHRHGNVYIKTFKCHYCSFKAAFKNEISRHEKKIHSIPMPKSEISKKAKKSMKAYKSMKIAKGLKHSITSSDDVLSEILRFPQSLRDDEEEKEENVVMDALEEINAAVAINETKLKEEELSNGESKMDDSTSGRNSPEMIDEPIGEHSSDSKEMSPSKDHGKKKGQSFFEKLQEKIPTSNVQNLVCQFCGHESKCLSESVRHQKLHLSAKNIYASASLSTRCQFCRHRCKTTDDLITHLKLCPEARKNQITDSGRRPSGVRGDDMDDSGDLQPDRDEDSKDSNDNLEIRQTRSNSVTQDEGDDKYEEDKHPMENRVFVWNNFQVQEDAEQNAEGSKIKEDLVADLKDHKNLSPEDLHKNPGKRSLSVSEDPLDYIESPSPQGNHYYSKRVYRCPQCSFWATTASRFHVHIVGHFNKKPYNCSECGYKSNWRWDITKHIKLKTSRDNSHQGAQVIITDETGEKNYEKYDCYLAIIQLDETNAHRTEGGIPTRKGRPKRTPEKEEEKECVTPSISPVRKPPMVSIPVMPRMQGLPRLTRAPGSRNRPGPMPFGPILPGPQMMVQLAGSAATSGTSNSRPPPPLSLRGTSKGPPTSTPSTSRSKSSSSRESTESPTANAQYQIITPQGAVNTSLETLQLLASGSTNISRLKKQQQEKGGSDASEEKDRQDTVSHQVSVSSTGEDGREVAKMVLDHEGNPEWKCHSCDFRDSERETVVQHVRLAHARGGPVSLLHAVHRCDVCGYAAGTKRAVQLHIDSSHGGQGGITSRCEGQTPDSKDNSGDSENMEYNESTRMFQCRQCPFSSKKRSEMRSHVAYHAARPDCIFKCMFCPFYVPTKGELFEHLNVHGMEVPASVLEAANKVSSTAAPITEDIGGGSRNLACDSCPFETRSRAKLMHHRQFHKPKGLPFRCPHCTYNVTRRHLLSQHIRVHGMDPVLDDSIEVSSVNDNNQADDRSNSPSPSLTITPVNNVAASGNTGDDNTVTDSSLLPKLTDQSTMVLDDIPLVWVSRDNRFFKMFKCRHCPHVNLRKTNIQEHEKMHKTDSARESGGLHCPYCSYVSVNAGVMSAHMKVHAGSMGQCHAIVDPSLSDEDQLRQLTTRASTSRPETPQTPEIPASTMVPTRKADEKVLYYCQQCPARFFFEKEIQIHTRFHTTTLPHKCDHCNYGARQQAHLLAHLKVHTPEYQQRTRTMMSQHRTATTHPPVPGLTIPHEASVETSNDSHDSASNSRPFTASPPPTSVPQPPPTSKYMCDECPASFSKLLTLQYHQSLHGANNPHKCQRCSYAGKTAENLQQHHLLHSQYDENVQAEKAAKEPPPPPTPPPPPPPPAPKPAPAPVTTPSEPPAPKVSESQKSAPSQEPSKSSSKTTERDSSYHPPIKLKLIGLRPISSENGSGGRPQFKYYVEEQIPLSGVDLLRRKTQLEKEGQDKITSNESGSSKGYGKSKSSREKEEVEEDDPKRIGDPKLYYPMHIDKVTGKSREKRYKCNKCPSAFEKTEQYYVHSNLHGSNHKYRCRICDYSVKFFANFMMHINRHKYHERMLSQNGEGPPPEDIDPKYDPIISSSDNTQGEKPSKSRGEESNKENLDDVDLTTSERQHLLLQNKKGVKEPASKEDEKERRVYYCQYCPYANVRRDAVDSHSLRHQANGGYGVYKCTFCDYTASQPNFIREHTKVHFRPFKYVHPEGFMRHDRQEILSAPIALPGSKAIDGPKLQDSKNASNVEDRYLIFSHDAGVYKPPIISNAGEEEEPDSHIASGIQVNFRSGDIVEAPNDFVISLRPGAKIRTGAGIMEPSDPFAADGLDSAASSVQGESAQCSADIVSKAPPVEVEAETEDASEDKADGMDVDTNDPTEGEDQTEDGDNAATGGAAQGPLIEEDEETRLTNGHAHMEVDEGSKEEEVSENEEEGAKMEVVAEGDVVEPAAEGSSADQLPAAKKAVAQPEPLVSS
ncbi:uncharacterized protein LOC122262059 isoform X2 [Penaeus japonicus]|uniref:uncharacterized protein LOC122262059 isoform X2 n=1 Tax=Penaeus japonicus TaxID=27405 RepID=UPI001C716FEB|nr:uncharacterized protein LOC122262059 isoform X2 [Penaeus japonicus]